MPVGYDNLSLNTQLLYHLALDEIAVGATPPVHDKAKPHHTSILHGGSWNNLVSGLPYIDLSPNPDFIDCSAAATADLNFTSGDFSMCAWVYIDDISVRRAILCRGAGGLGGWLFEINTTGTTSFRTYQAGTDQESRGITGDIVISEWVFVSASRVGASARIYKNGMHRQSYIPAHVDPDGVALELHVGVRDNELDSPMDGRIAGGRCGPRIWGRDVKSEEWRAVFEMERHWFGV